MLRARHRLTLPIRRKGHSFATREPGHTSEFGLQFRQTTLARSHAELRPERAHDKAARVRIPLHVDASDQAIALQYRKDIVAVSPLGLRDEDLNPISEAKEAFCTIAVAECGIKGRENADPNRGVGRGLRLLQNIRPR